MVTTRITRRGYFIFYKGDYKRHYKICKGYRRIMLKIYSAYF